MIAIGGSAGGLDALMTIVPRLPVDLDAAVLVVLHIPPNAPSSLPELLARAGPLPTASARDGEPLLPGHIYIAPPDRHLLVESARISLSPGPRENHARPAVDPMMRSAALAFGPRVIGVVLSGLLSDGTAGLWEVKQRGGIAVVQDPGEASYPSMPHTAMDQVPVDYVLPASEIANQLVQLVAHLPSERQPPAAQEGEAVMAVGDEPKTNLKPGSAEVERDMTAQIIGERDGSVAVYVCPDCGGTLWQVNAGTLLRFRCHIGHVYSGEDLMEGYTTELEDSLWRVVRTMRDKINLEQQLATLARQRGDNTMAERYEEKAYIDEEHLGAIEQMIVNHATGPV